MPTLFVLLVNLGAVKTPLNNIRDALLKGMLLACSNAVLQCIQKSTKFQSKAAPITVLKYIQIGDSKVPW